MLEFSKRFGICLGIAAAFCLGACGDDDSSTDKGKIGGDSNGPVACNTNDDCKDVEGKPVCSEEAKVCIAQKDDGETGDGGGGDDSGNDGDTTTQECKEPNQICGSICTDIKTDSANCGACGTACQAEQICDSGTCKFDCKDGKTACEDGCYDLQNDPTHCGKCETKCNTSGGEEDSGGEQLTCKAGQCVADCGTLTACDSGCADLQSDNNNCGSCGKVCKVEENMFCTDGTCTKTCPAGQSPCGDKCVDLDEDAQNCGKCENVCTGGTVCINGECGNQCQPNETVCDGQCFDLSKSKEHCGSCEKACEGDLVCGNGNCVQGCPEDGQIACEGSCINPKTDILWCGAEGTCAEGSMGTICSSNATCDEGKCKCPADAADLCKISERETVCVNAQTSDQYCGCGDERNDNEAGVDCSALSGITEGHCVSGVCEITCDNTHASCDSNPATGCETDITTIEHCGACDNVCSAENATETACVLGVCKPTCKEGFVDCNGKCIALDSDKANCGFCGNACNDNEECNDGFCQIEECGDDGYAYVTVLMRKSDGTRTKQKLKAYCINDLTMFKSFQSTINAGNVYPSSVNTDQAYILMNNIALNKISWTPIGTVSKPFTGRFLGNGYKIVGNLTTKGHYTGLFGYVKDAVLDGFDLMVSVDGSVDTLNADHFENLGALVGYAENSVISRIVQSGTVNGDTNTGGVVGQAKDSDIEMIRATVTVTGQRKNASGILGAGNNVKLNDCTAVADVDIKKQKIYEKQGNEYVLIKEDNFYKQETGYFQDWSYSGVVGKLDNSTVTNCHSSGTIGKAGESLHGSAGLIGYSSNSTIKNCSSTSTVRGAAYMGGLMAYCSKCDISDSSYSGTVTTSWHNGGLISDLRNGTITNCHVSGEVKGSTHDNGGIVGYGSNVTIKDSVSEAHVASNHGGTYPWNGGIAGRLSSSSIINCVSTGNVWSTNHGGGIIGSGNKVTIENCRASGNVTNKGTGTTYITSGNGFTEDAYGMFGGIAGYLSNNSKVIRSVATGNITGHLGVGGLVGGLFNSTIEQSESFGTVTGNRAGGLVGVSKDTTKLTTCASIGDTKGEDSGSLIGYLLPGVHTLKNVYGTGSVAGVRNAGAIFGQIDTSTNNSVSLKSSYYWENIVNDGTLVGAGASAFTSKVKTFKYDENNVAVLEDTSKLLDALGTEDWTAATCKLSSGPGTSTPADYTFPVIKAIGADICK